MDSHVDAIRRAPNSDEPKLAYAEWLIARGDPLGELIQIQCRLKQLTEGDRDFERCRNRNLELLESIEPRLLGPLRELGVRDFKIDCGLVHLISIPCPAFAEFGEQIVAQAPFLQTVRFTDGSAAAARTLGATPSLNIVRTAVLVGEWSNEGFAEFIASPHLSGLEVLIAQGLGLDATALGTLRQACFQLERLLIADNNLGDGISSLVGANCLKSVEMIGVSGNSIGPTGLSRLADSCDFPNLSQLSIDFNQLGNPGAQWLSRSHAFAKLVELWVGANEIDGEGASAFGSSSCKMQGLRDLSVFENPILDEGVSRLANAPFFAVLERLNLADCGLSDVAVEALCSTPRCQLRALNLDSNEIGDDSCLALATSESMMTLNELSLSCTPISDEGVIAIVESIRSLRRIDLTNVMISEDLYDYIVTVVPEVIWNWP